MKRIYVAIGLLLSVAVLCVITLNIQTKSIQELIETADTMQTALKKKEMEQCLKISYEFVDKYKSSTDKFPYFMRHSEVSKIEENIVALPIMLESNDLQHFAAELAKCKDMLENMADLETPTLEDIF
mgnify:FL=1